MTSKSIKGTRTERNLVIAYVAESTAYSRYTYYAQAADKEEYFPIGVVFNETAQNELRHAKVFFKLLEGGSVHVPVDVDAGVIGTTAENLATAIREEEMEGVELYTESAKVADEEGFAEIASHFRAIAEIEARHRERFLHYLKQVKDGTVWKREKPILWKCLVCGYVAEGTEPPEECPACDHPYQHYMALDYPENINLDTTRMTEYMVYLPLYDGVNSLEIKVDSAATITSGNPAVIDGGTKIVAYGTSILQGGCASRTGMAATNIISRELNCEVVNIGISGEGKMDPCMARAMAQIPDADLYIIDPVPNCTEMMCDTLTYDFVNILRKAKPDVPVVMVEGPIYPYARYDSFFGRYLPAKNAAFHRNYLRLKEENPEGLYYVTSENLDGIEDDGTVDGIHLTDLGFRHYADKLTPILRDILSRKR